MVNKRRRKTESKNVEDISIYKLSGILNNPMIMVKVA